MRNKMKKIITILIVIFIAGGCKDKPTSLDGNAKAQFIVIDTSGALDKDPATNLRVLKNGEISFHSIDYNTSFKFTTDSRGIVSATGLIGSKYTIAVNFPVSDNISVLCNKDIDIYSSFLSLDTIYLKSVPSSPIIISEFYYCGPVNNKRYFYDLFLELYNNSDQVRYLDGLMFIRAAFVSEGVYEPGIVDLGNNVFGIRVSSQVYQFPGEPGGTSYPIQPGQYVVVAGDAGDHSALYPTSINLSTTNPIFPENPATQNATTSKSQLWEMYNPNGTDGDDLKVPNVVSRIASTTSKFLPSLTNDAIVLFSGKKGIIYQGSNIYIDLSTVLDGIQYSEKVSGNKKLDGRVDAGVGGIGISSYSGKSIERIADPKNPKKLFDSNNSTSDFGINDKPTPGYHGNPKQ
jgi:hypothetical protein